MLNKKYTLQNVKEYLKKVAEYIRIKKQLRKTVYCDLSSFNNIDILHAEGQSLCRLRDEFRSLHIAYCLYRGRAMTQIENGNDCVPYMSNQFLREISKDMEEFRNEREKTLCISK